MRNLLLLLFSLCFTCLLAQPVEDDLPQITGCIALVNAKVVTTAGKEPVVQNVIMRNGLITQIGAGAKIPNDAYRIQADSLYVYPAFIDAFSHIGIKEPEQPQRGGGPGGQGGQNRPVVDEEGNASLDEAGITPYVHVRSTFDPKEKSISDWRSQGFAIAHVVPRGKIIPGQGAIAILAGKDADQMLWKEDVSFYGQWTGAGGSYPGTVIGVMAKWRELYKNASQNVTHLASYNTATMVSRPNYNQAHEALMPLVKKEMPLYFKAGNMKEISRALELQKDLGMRMVIADAKEAWLIKNQIKAKAIPLILSLDIPEDKSEDKEKAKEKAKEEAKAEEKVKTEDDTMTEPDSTKVKQDTVAKDPEKIEFERRRAESLKEHLKQPAVLAEAQIPFSFGTVSGKSGDFYKTFQAWFENGYDKNAALNALTLQPAKLLGIEKYVGTLETGKMANMIVSNKPIFEKEAAIKYMIVEGNLFKYEIKEKKKPSAKAKEEDVKTLEGTWSYSIDTPEQKREGTFEFTQEDGEWKGTISSSQITSGNSTLKDIVVEGNKVSFTFDFDMGGQAVELEFDMTVNGDTFDGSVAVGEYGTYPMTGKRTAKPE